MPNWFAYFFDKLVQMMNHIGKNRPHILNPLDIDIHGMDFHIRNVRNHFRHRFLKCHTDTAIVHIVLVAVGKALLQMALAIGNKDLIKNISQ